MVASSIGLLALGAALVFWAFASRTCASLLGYTELSNTSKIALDRASQQIRNAKAVKVVLRLNWSCAMPPGRTSRCPTNQANKP